MGRHRLKYDNRDYFVALCDLRNLNQRDAVSSFWRTLALTLLRECQQRDPGLARVVGTIADRHGLNLEVCLDQPAVDGRLVGRFSKDFQSAMADVPSRLGRGHVKPEPAISDDGLVELYDRLRAAIRAIRTLERNRDAEASARYIVEEVFGVTGPLGEWSRREELVRKLAAGDSRARLVELFRAAARWFGLRDPSDARLNEMVRFFSQESAPSRAAKMIVAALLGVSDRTVENRLSGKRALRLPWATSKRGPRSQPPQN